MITNMKFYITISIFSFFAIVNTTAQNKAIKTTFNWQAVKKGENNSINFLSNTPNYFTISFLKNKKNRIQEMGINLWNLNNSEVLNFNLKERNFGIQYGYGWNLLDWKKGKIQLQLVNSLRASYGYLRTESKFFKEIYDKDAFFGLALLVNPRINFRINSKWILSLESQIVPAMFRYTSTQSFIESIPSNKSSESSFDGFEELTIGLGIGYKL